MFLNEYAGILNGPPGLSAAGQDTETTIQSLYARIMKRPAYPGEIDNFIRTYGTTIDDGELLTIADDLTKRGSDPVFLNQTKNIVIDLFRKTLKREPTQNEIDYWIDQWGISMEGAEYQAFIDAANIELAQIKPLTPEIATQLMIKSATTGLLDSEGNQYGGYQEILRVFRTTGQDLDTLVKNLDRATANNLAAQIAISGQGSISFMDSVGQQLTQTGLINMISNEINDNTISSILQATTIADNQVEANAIIAQAKELASQEEIATAAAVAGQLVSQVNQTGIGQTIVNDALVQFRDQMQETVDLQNAAIKQQQKNAAAAAVAAAATTSAEQAKQIANAAEAIKKVTQTTTLTTGLTNVNTASGTTGTTQTTGTVTVGKTSGTTGNLAPLLFIAGAAFLLGKI
jgi:hypothetical protein